MKVMWGWNFERLESGVVVADVYGGIV